MPTASVPSTPAILNAVCDATTVRIYDLSADPGYVTEKMAS